MKPSGPSSVALANRTCSPHFSFMILAKNPHVEEEIDVWLAEKHSRLD